MLYVTTRVEDDAFTANRALSENRGPGGGFFVPMQMPSLSPSDLSAMAEKPFARNMADVINQLFNTQLDPWALEFGIGRRPVKTVNLGSRTTVVQTWHNPAWRFERLAMGVEKAIRQSDQVSDPPADWLVIAARIGVLFGVFGELLHAGAVSVDTPVDVAVPMGNFSAPMALWYARQWGLPIGTIVVCCNENGAVWNLLHKGEIRTDAVAAHTGTPACDYTVPPDLERLIFAALGREETQRYCQVCRRGGTYYLEAAQLRKLQNGIWVTVVGRQRMESAVSGLYATDGYIPDPYTALAFSGLCDFRAATGSGRNALLISDESPAFSFGMIAGCMGMSQSELKDLLNKQI